MNINLWFLMILSWLISFGFFNNGAVSFALSIAVLIGFLVLNSFRRSRYSEKCFSKDELDSIENVMKDPSGISMSDYEEKVRRNIIFVSSTSIFFVLFDLKVGANSSILGIKIENLNEKIVFYVLLTVLAYELINYCWNLKISFMKWRIRLTGCLSRVLRGDIDASFFHEELSPLDKTGEDQNSNLYLWYLENKNKFNEIIDKVENSMSDFDNSYDSGSYFSKKESFINSNSAEKLSNSIKKLDLIFNNKRLLGSLMKFDQWFKILLVSQGLKWIVLDVIFPFFLALWAIYLLLLEIC